MRSLTGDGIPAVNTSYLHERPPSIEDHLRGIIRILKQENYWLRMALEKKRIADNPKFDYRGCP